MNRSRCKAEVPVPGYGFEAVTNAVVESYRKFSGLARFGNCRFGHGRRWWKEKMRSRVSACVCSPARCGKMGRCSGSQI